MNFKVKALMIAIIAILNFSGCKEDEKSLFPTPPTSYSIEDGAVVNTTTVMLDAKGSTCEQQNAGFIYRIYVGTSPDNMQRIDEENTAYKDGVPFDAEPYTQYFWRVDVSGFYSGDIVDGDEGEIRTFYCIPDLKIETDQGENEWAAVMRWEKVENIKDVKISVTADHKGYNFDDITIPAGQDTCYIASSIKESCVKPYNDETGDVYEPVIYTFNFSFNIEVGDKMHLITKEVKNVILDKSMYVCDHEFNVYRVCKIGNQTWLADNLRTTSYYENADRDNLGKLIELKEGEDYVTYTLPSGSVGYYYCGKRYIPNNLCRVIKGFDRPTQEDFDILINQYYSKEKAFAMLASQYDWNDKEIIPEQIGVFNIKPFGFYSTTKNEFIGVGELAFIPCSWHENGSAFTGPYVNKEMADYDYGGFFNILNYPFSTMRLIKK